jgi:hypothetical protein
MPSTVEFIGAMRGIGTRELFFQCYARECSKSGSEWRSKNIDRAQFDTIWIVIVIRSWPVIAIAAMLRAVFLRAGADINSLATAMAVAGGALGLFAYLSLDRQVSSYAGDINEAAISSYFSPKEQLKRRAASARAYVTLVGYALFGVVLSKM